MGTCPGGLIVHADGTVAGCNYCGVQHVG